MNTTTTTKAQFTTFQPQGYLSAANAQRFREKLTVAITSSFHSVLLVDMGAVEFMDSAGLMALIDAFRLAQSLERRLSICSLAPSVRIMFELTQLDNAFEIFEDRQSFETALA